jgi:MSHA biogenesis protein MshQ
MGVSTISLGLGLGGGKAATASGRLAGGGFVNQFAISLDGTDDFISCGNDSSLAPANISYSAWVKVSGSIDSFNYILAKGGARYGSYFLRYTSSNTFIAWLGFASSQFATVTSSSATLTNWNHVVFTYDQTNMKIYVNAGTPQTAAETRAIDYAELSGHSTDFEIGRTPYGFPALGEGLIDEVAIFNSALTASQISNIYKGEENGGSGGTNGVPGDLSTFNPVGWWRMGDGTEAGSGTTIFDMSTNSNNGTLTNGPTFSTSVPS